MNFIALQKGAGTFRTPTHTCTNLYRPKGLTEKTFLWTRPSISTFQYMDLAYIDEKIWVSSSVSIIFGLLGICTGCGSLRRCVLDNWKRTVKNRSCFTRRRSDCPSRTVWLFSRKTRTFLYCFLLESHETKNNTEVLCCFWFNGFPVNHSVSTLHCCLPCCLHSAV